MSSKKDNSSHRFMAKVPNTDEGWKKIEALKGMMNKDRYRLVYKYNGKSIPGVYKRGWYHCKKEYATEVRVYLNVKYPIQDRELIDKKTADKRWEIQQEEMRHRAKLRRINEEYSWYLNK